MCSFLQLDVSREKVASGLRHGVKMENSAYHLAFHMPGTSVVFWLFWGELYVGKFDDHLQSSLLLVSHEVNHHLRGWHIWQLEISRLLLYDYSCLRPPVPKSNYKRPFIFTFFSGS
jgi:hypothetical protein